MARQVLTGVPELEATLTAYSDKLGDKVAKASLRSGVSVLAREMKKTAPVGATGQLKKSIGSRVGKTSGGVYVAKAGINVGRKTKRTVGRMAPHGHLVALGTQRRTRQTMAGLYGGNADVVDPAKLTTGVMPANPFIKLAYQSARGRATAAMQRQAAKTLAREAAKLKK